MRGRNIYDAMQHDARGVASQSGIGLPDIMSSTQKTSAPSAGPRSAVTFSIIITNYNYAQYLGHAIESVLAQTHATVQCIVADDGSTDTSLKVAHSYPGIEVIAKENGGQVSAARRAIEAATGELTIFLDSDDTLYPDACAIVAGDYRADATLYQYGLDKVDPEGRTIGHYPDAPLIREGQRAHALAHGFFPSSPTSGNAFSTAHVRRMLAESGPVERYFVDGYLIYSAPFFGETVTSDAKLGSYLVHGANVSLSAGVNARSAEKSTRNAIWQRNGIVNALRLTGKNGGEAADYLTAYHLRYILILRRCYGIDDMIPTWSDSRVAWSAIVKFLIYPGLSAGQRLRNVALILATLIGAKGPGRGVVPPATALAPTPVLAPQS